MKRQARSRMVEARSFVLGICAFLLGGCIADTAAGRPALYPAELASTARSGARGKNAGGEPASGTRKPRPGKKPVTAARRPDAGGDADGGDLESLGTDLESQLSFPTPIEDASGEALASFYNALTRAKQGEGQARVVFYGASHVAADVFTHRIRKNLQARFGDAGAGFVLPAKPWRWYRHSTIAVERGSGWKVLRMRNRSPKEERYGFAGVALESRADRRATGALATRDKGELPVHASRFELYFMKQPDGGRVLVFLDGERVGSISTRADSYQGGYALYQTDDGPHKLEIRASGNGPVRVFGVAVERELPGVILDTVGIPGARARNHLLWNDELYREQLARRKPDLVALAYGTNESGDDDVPVERYEEELRQMLSRIRETVPEASCLLIGPSDRPRTPAEIERLASERDEEESTDEDEWPEEWQGYAPRPLTEEIVAVQRRVTRDLGCGFFDTLGFMGGPMSMVRWVAADPPLAAADHIHFTFQGYELLGEEIFRALMAGYPEE